jgi:hypothetical protein
MAHNEGRVDAITIARDVADSIAAAPPVTWAIRRLRSALDARQVPVRILGRSDADVEGSHSVLVAGAGSSIAASAAEIAGRSMPTAPESFALAPRGPNPDSGLLVVGADVRGLVYALLELADRVEYGGDARHALTLREPTIERPANAVRSVARLFCSEAEDKGWFYDEAFWHRYLTMIASQRFNRFSLTLGLGYNYPRGVTDAYLYFAYPFLVSVPGYDVRVPQLPQDERERNLQMLRLISEQTTARGLDFQLGLWTHAYRWIDSSEAHHTIEGLEPDTHAAYCRDAVRTLLELCPSIGGVTFRIHGESGVPEGSWEFWRTVFDGVAGCDRPVGLDLHAKGLDETTLGHALATGLPVTVSPKFWAEHMGLPYHQAAIREIERTPREDPSHLSEWHRHMSVSEGSRPFTRYGYADFLRENRPYDVVFRLWPGTQRMLLWGDPAFAAGYGRAASIAGSQGLEWFEPLSFKGREGTGIPGTRTGYSDQSLVPQRDWEKYAYTYRLFGRLTYDPSTSPEAWRRPLRTHFGAAAHDAESALASASRILPLVTVAHHPSASNNYYWPELYTDIPIVWSEEGTRPHPYVDTPTPRRFGTVSPLDPEVFSSVEAFVEECLDETSGGRMSPLDVARRLDDLAENAHRHLSAVNAQNPEADAEVRRWTLDIGIQAALGRFFANKLRASVYYEAHARTRSRSALGRAVEACRVAGNAWTEAAERATGVYVDDLTFGPQRHLRGHWIDRIEAIDGDLQAMEEQWNAASDSAADADDVVETVEEAAFPRPIAEVRHVSVMTFEPLLDLTLAIEITGANAASVDGVTLRYRPMDHQRTYAAIEMHREHTRFAGSIPGADLHGDYPVAYVFVVRHARGAWRHPDIGDDLTTQPYFVTRPRADDPVHAPGALGLLARPGNVTMS